MKIFWLYELDGGSGVFQGCCGEDAEDVVRQVADESAGDGKPFSVLAVDHNRLKPRQNQTDEEFIRNNASFVLDLLAAVAQMKGSK